MYDIICWFINSDVMQEKRMAYEESTNYVRRVEQREQEPRVQHQPDVMERLATLMAQYMEYQLARPARGTTIHE